VDLRDWLEGTLPMLDGVLAVLMVVAIVGLLVLLGTAIFMKPRRKTKPGEDRDRRLPPSPWN